MTSSPAHALSIRCVTGLANRLYALTSGLTLAEASGRTFRMLWPRTQPCGALFGELFSNKWNVIEKDPANTAETPFAPARRKIDVLVDPTSEIQADCIGSLLDPSRFPRHAALSSRDFEFFQQLTPIPELAETIAQFRVRHFRPAMIGVHLRRGDFIQVHGDIVDNTRKVMASVDRLLAQTPEAGIFLCSDDGATAYWNGAPMPCEGLREKFQARYGERVVWRPALSLDRRCSAAIQDAVVDLWLLRQTTAFVGTYSSSFSRLVLHGRSVPSVLCQGYNLKYASMEYLCRITGLYFLMRYHCQKRHGFVPSFPIMGRYYKALFLRAVLRKATK